MTKPITVSIKPFGPRFVKNNSYALTRELIEDIYYITYDVALLENITDETEATNILHDLLHATAASLQGIINVVCSVTDWSEEEVQKALQGHYELLCQAYEQDGVFDND